MRRKELSQEERDEEKWIEQIVQREKKLNIEKWIEKMVQRENKLNTESGEVRQKK